jgi:hypothetical protein
MIPYTKSQESLDARHERDVHCEKNGRDANGRKNPTCVTDDGANNAHRERPLDDVSGCETSLGFQTFQHVGEHKVGSFCELQWPTWSPYVGKTPSVGITGKRSVMIGGRLYDSDDIPPSLLGDSSDASPDCSFDGTFGISPDPV